MRTLFLVGIVLAFISYMERDVQMDMETGLEEENIVYAHDTNKEWVVIVPGLYGSSAAVFFQGIIPRLTPFYNVIVAGIHFDPSTKDLSEPNHESFHDLADRLEESLEQTLFQHTDTHNHSIKCIIGQSFGGILAQLHSLKYPERSQSLVLLSSLGGTDVSWKIKAKIYYLLPFIEILGYAFPGSAQGLFARIHLYDVIRRDEPKWLKQLYIKEISWAHHSLLMRQIRSISDLDIVHDVRNITQQTLLLYGKDDLLAQEGTLRLAQYIPHSRAIGMPGGHFAHLLQPRHTFELILNFCS